MCLDGYEGDNCDTVTGCIKLKKKCDEIEKECIFDEDAPGKAVCKCDGGFKYDSENNKCQSKCIYFSYWHQQTFSCADIFYLLRHYRMEYIFPKTVTVRNIYIY